MPHDGMRVRTADAADAVQIDRMLRSLAALEGTESDLEFQVNDLRKALASPALPLQAIVAEHDETLVGCVTFTRDFALWSGGTILRIDDVFVSESYRGAGVGSAMMAHVATIALDENAPVRWEVETSNARAVNFYNRLGVTLKPKLTARWSLNAMHRIVNASPYRGSI